MYQPFKYESLEGARHKFSVEPHSSAFLVAAWYSKDIVSLRDGEILWFSSSLLSVVLWKCTQLPLKNERPIITLAQHGLKGSSSAFPPANLSNYLAT